MIDKIITAYLKNNKRLVIPEFGAFINKDGEEVVFVEFLKKDDRVLTSLLCREFAINETEAQNAIDEYVMKIRRTVGKTGKYVVEGLGSLHTDVNGLYALAFDPRVCKDTPEIDFPTPEEPAPVHVPERPVMQVYTRETAESGHTPPQAERARPDGGEDSPEPEREDISKSYPNVIEFGFPHQKPEPEPKPIDKKPFTLNDLYSVPASENTRDERPKPTPRPDEHSQRQPHTLRDDRARQPQRRDDRYGRQQRPVDQSAPERRVRRDDDWEDESPRRRPVNTRKRKRTIGDWIMIIAIIVALFALGTIIYGVVTTGSMNIKHTDQQIENTVDPDAPAVVDGVVTEVELGGGA